MSLVSLDQGVSLRGEYCSVPPDAFREVMWADFVRSEVQAYMAELETPESSSGAASSRSPRG